MSGTQSGGLVPAVPPNLRIPLAYFTIGTGTAGTQYNQRALLIGASLIAQPAVPMLIGGTAAAVAAFGRGSMLARMVAAYRANDPIGEIWCLPLPAAAVAAAGGMTVAGAATAPGTLALYTGGQAVPVAVAQGDTAATVLANAAAALNAALDQPVTAATPAANATSVALTARGLGAVAAGIDLRLNYYGSSGAELTPPGLTVSFTPFTGGSPDPDMTAPLAARGGVDYDFVISGYAGAAQLATLEGLMADGAGRWSYLSGQFGHVFYAKLPAAASANDAAAALFAFGNTRNGQHLTAWGCYDTPTPPWELAAAVTAACIPSLKARPNQPLQTLAVAGVLAPPVTSRFSKPQQQTLLSNGIALVAFDRAGNCQVLRAVTNYQDNPAGVPDQSYLDVETLFSLMAFVRGANARISVKFARSMLADNGTRFGAGVPVVTPAIIASDLIAYHAACERTGLTQNTDAFAAALVVQRSTADASRVDAVLDPQLVSGLRIFAALVNFNLNTALAA